MVAPRRSTFGMVTRGCSFHFQIDKDLEYQLEVFLVFGKDGESRLHWHHCVAVRCYRANAERISEATRLPIMLITSSMSMSLGDMRVAPPFVPV